MKITIREPGSAITHFIGAVLAMTAAAPLLLKAFAVGGGRTLFAMCVFIYSMVALYTASTVYHSVNVRERVLKVFQKVDHMMIFVLIAGSYTPVCMIVLQGRGGDKLLAFVWGMAGIGMMMNILWINCPKWLSSIIYILLGWACIPAFKPLMEILPVSAFAWLAAGGVLYTVGGVVYALKYEFFQGKYKNFGGHEVFHIFVLLGSLCHFIFMYFYVIMLLP